MSHRSPPTAQDADIVLTGESSPGYWGSGDGWEDTGYRSSSSWEDTGHRSSDGWEDMGHRSSSSWEDIGYSDRKGDTMDQGYRTEEEYSEDDDGRDIQEYSDWGRLPEDGRVLPQPLEGGWQGGLGSQA